jgi:hypothetical protein
LTINDPPESRFRWVVLFILMDSRLRRSVRVIDR